jgi:hypothetical protein
MKKPRGKRRFKQMRPPFADYNIKSQPSKIFRWHLSAELGMFIGSQEWGDVPWMSGMQYRVGPRKGLQNQIIPS